MELLLLLLMPIVVGSFFLGGDDDASDSPPDTPPDTDGDTLTGTAENNILRGTDTDDDVDGAAGNDLVFGNRGDDTITGGDGVDFLDGGPGDDVVFGGANGDVIAGGVGNDLLRGGSGRDLITGGAGDDTLVGDSDDDVLVGSTGADVLYGGAGNDFLNGVSPIAGETLSDATDDLRAEFSGALASAHGTAATGADLNRFLKDFTSETGASAPDMLYGGTGQDDLFGDDGDTMEGGEGSDLFEISWVNGNDPVSITDYTAEDRGITVYIDDDRTTVPDFSIRDAANGTGVEVLVDDDVVAALANIRLSGLVDADILLQMPNLDAAIPATRLPALAA